MTTPRGNAPARHITTCYPGRFVLRMPPMKWAYTLDPARAFDGRTDLWLQAAAIGNACARALDAPCDVRQAVRTGRVEIWTPAPMAHPAFSHGRPLETAADKKENAR